MTLSNYTAPHETAALHSLRRRWGLVALIYLGIWWLSHQLLQVTWQTGFANRWRYLSAAMACVLLGLLWRGLPDNRRSDTSKLWPTLGMANAVSLIRGILLFLLAGFLFLPRPTIALTWLPAALYTADRITDLFDGYIARVTRRESKLGAMLDIELDGLGLLVAVILGVQYGLLPAWYLLLAISRQLFVAGLWFRTRLHLPNADLPPSDNRRLIAGFQTGFLTVMLWPHLSPEVTHLIAYLFALPLIYSFGRDWLVVSHVIAPQTSSYQQVRHAIKQIFEQWLPTLMRLATPWGTWMTLLPLLNHPHMGVVLPAHPDNWMTALLIRILSNDSAVVASITYSGSIMLVGVAVIGVLLGICTRLAALVLLALGVIVASIYGLEWQGNGLLIISTAIVAHLGSGQWSLWQPEELWLHTEYGRQA